MNSREFVAALKLVAHEKPVGALLRSLEGPAGRRLDAHLVALSEWYHKLDPVDRDAVKQVAELASIRSLYNVLLVLDGLLAVEPAEPKGTFGLHYTIEGERIVLNRTDGEPLTSLFKDLAADP